MQVFHTAGVPPSKGSTILANIGWTRNSSAELRNRVPAKRTGSMDRRPEPSRSALLCFRWAGVALLFIQIATQPVTPGVREPRGHARPSNENHARHSDRSIAHGQSPAD